MPESHVCPQGHRWESVPASDEAMNLPGFTGPGKKKMGDSTRFSGPWSHNRELQLALANESRNRVGSDAVIAVV
jgi:hypothetical protein